MGAAAVGPRGLMQADVVLIQAEQKLMDRADQLIVLVDSSKFRTSASFVVCDLDAIDAVVTDAGHHRGRARHAARAGHRGDRGERHSLARQTVGA